MSTVDNPIYSYYLKDMFIPDRHERTIRWLTDKVKELQATITIDSLAVRGISGVMAASPVSLQTGIPITLVRKPGDKSHYQDETSGRTNVEGKMYGNYVIIDDIISTGATVADIIGQIKDDNEERKCIAIILYNSEKYTYSPKGLENHAKYMKELINESLKKAEWIIDQREIDDMQMIFRGYE